MSDVFQKKGKKMRVWSILNSGDLQEPVKVLELGGREPTSGGRDMVGSSRQGDQAVGEFLHLQG